MRNHKILFIGPVGSGKTTAIGAVSEVPVICTDQFVSDMTRWRKEKTTVAFDYGIMHLGHQDRVHLYGAPGQERFDFMWDILKRGVSGLVILLDNSRPSPRDDLDFYLRWCHEALGPATSVVIGVNLLKPDRRHDLKDTPILRTDGGMARTSLPLFEIDARRKADVAKLVQALLSNHDGSRNGTA